LAEPFLGEIRLAGFNFAPVGWALCQGQLISIPQNEALFSLLGTIYGGDGTNTFGLPNLQGRIPLGQGQGPGLANRTIGQVLGEESVSLTTNQLPSHNHPAACASGGGNNSSPQANYWSTDPGGNTATYTAPANANGTMAPDALAPASGGGQPHDNLQPFLVINYIIALQGIYPSRS
jgi:microcystin-dependent protein